MKGNKLYQLIKTLDAGEWKNLRKFVRSPIYNTNERVVQLYELLRPRYPNFEDSPKQKEKLFRKIYIGEQYNYHKIHVLFTLLTQLIEDYLVLLELRRSKLEREKLLLKSFRHRNNYTFYKKSTERLGKEVEAMPYRNTTYFLEAMQLYEAKYFHPVFDKHDVKDDTLDLLMATLDHYFALAKMSYGVALKSRERLLAKPTEFRLLDAVELEGGNGWLKNDVTFQLYRTLFAMLNGEQLIDFEQYEKQLFQYFSSFDENTQKILFIGGLNFVNRQMNKGIGNFQAKTLEWYRFGLRVNLFMDNGQLEEVAFGNIVILACQQKAFAWAKDFMETYAVFLEKSKRQEIVLYHQGLWHFYQNDYDAVFSVWFNYEFSSVYIPKTRWTIIRALFSKFLIDPTFFASTLAHIKSFENYIDRNKTHSSSRLQPHLNAIRLIRKLVIKIDSNTSKEAIRTFLEQEFQSGKSLLGKKWLKEKFFGKLKLGGNS